MCTSRVKQSSTEISEPSGERSKNPRKKLKQQRAYGNATNIFDSIVDEERIAACMINKLRAVSHKARSNTYKEAILQRRD